MQREKISINDFAYPLASGKIAKFPLHLRDQSKLLVYQQGKISENSFAHLHQYIPEQAMIIFNNTKVIEARIQFQKPTGGSIEVFCLEPDDQYANLPEALSQKGRVFWKCLIGGASKWKKGQHLEKTMGFNSKEVRLRAEYRSKKSAYFIIELSWIPAELTFAELLPVAGSIPLPPYLKREPTGMDADRYQTIYASSEGSVAAPTAGLHFTGNIFEKLTEKGIKMEFITLHVGAGTFKPVNSDSLDQHQMHEEYVELSRAALLSIAHHYPRPIIPVGTTSLRTIESLYWLGIKTILEPGIQKELLTLDQWEAYELNAGSITAKEALHGLASWLDRNQLDPLITKTKLLISPGYEFKIAKALITNFHQPRSTLLLLVAALIGEDWKKVYEYALNHQFRFLSYGDGCLFFS